MNDLIAKLRSWFAQTELRGRALWVVIGCLICQMGLGLTYVKSGLSTDLIEALHLTRTQFSGANTPQLAVQAFASPLAGYLTVRYGASRVLAGSALFFALVFLVFARVESVAGFYFAIAGVGLGAAGMGDVTVGHVVTQWIRKNRGLALGIAYAGSNLGGSVMMWLTGAVSERFGLRSALLSVVLFSLVVLLPASIFMVRDRDQEAPSTADGDVAAAIARADAIADTSLDLRAALRTRTFWILTTTLFTFFFYFTGVLDHFVLSLTDSGLPNQEARWYLGLAIGLGIVSKIAGGFVADRIRHEKAILYDYGLLAVSSVVLLLLPNPILLWVFVLTYGFSQAARDVVYPLVIERCFGARHLASIYGTMTLTLLPGAALGPLMAARLRDSLGAYRLAFAIFAVLNLVSVAALLLVRDERAPIDGTGRPPAIGPRRSTSIA